MTTRPPWYRRAFLALRCSLKLRMVMVFLLLAMAMSFTFISGAQKAFSVGWREAARPVLMDYVDRLAADVAGGGSPSIERAQALAQRLPLTIDIVGPQVTREHFERVDGFVQRAENDGARAVFGGGPNDELGGLYYRPTLFTDVPAGAEIVTQEVFGPVLTLQPFTDEDEAVALANDTDYGLAAIVYTGDPGRAERVSERLVAGTVWVNCFFVRDLAAPFGGSRNSGIGREGGQYALDFYSDLKSLQILQDTTRAT